MIRAMYCAHFNKLRVFLIGAACFCHVPMALAKMDTGNAAAQSAAPLPPPVPASISWIGAMLLALMWLAIAAIVLGPLVRFFAPKQPPEPKNLPSVY